MRLLLELSGEHPTLPAAEALAVLGLHGEVREEGRDAALLVADASRVEVAALAGRLGLTHEISEALAQCAPEPEAILTAVAEVASRVGPVFRVRVHRLGEHGRALRPSALEREAGALLAEGRKVAFTGPADELRILVGERAHLGLSRAKIDRRPFDARHVRHRPAFKPVSLHPRFARAMVNLARVRPGDRVADPFCGTGGLLVEAGLLGARCLGADLDPAMADGTRAFLTQHGLPCETKAGDVAETLASFAPLDAIVSDPPYGRASSTAREVPAKLYERALAAMASALQPGGRVVIVFPSAEAAKLAPASLILEHDHVQRVHRSLDRHYLVMRKE